MTTYIQFEEGWRYMQAGITKLKSMLKGLPEGLEPHFSSQEYMFLYTTIYCMCTQDHPHDFSQQLYDKYKDTFNEYIKLEVVPSLKEKHNAVLLRELIRRWLNHKIMMEWLSMFFRYLDRHFIPRRALPPLEEVGLTCFGDMVYQELHERVSNAVRYLIVQDRGEEQIDRALLKNVLDMLVDIKMGQTDDYESVFEAAVLLDAAAYYSQKAARWISHYACSNYMVNAEECLKREKDRVSHYLRSSSVLKLLEKVQHELLSVHAARLLEKEHCLALLRNGKGEDLSRIYRLYSEMACGLEPVADIFKEHVMDEGIALIKQPNDAASTKKEFVGKVIVLHDKFMAYVNDWFLNHTLFHKALKKAFFEVFFNRGVAGSYSAELLATFCDNILKKGGGEKLSDEVIEETLSKVVGLADGIDDKDLFFKLYRDKLADRLLFDESANNEHERNILANLKYKYNERLILYMESMFTDLAQAKEIQEDFEDYLGKNTNAYPWSDLKVTVLKARGWPNYKSFDVNLPTEMVKCLEVFREFYQGREGEGRILTWIDSPGCIISVEFEQKTIDLILTMYQAAALLLFDMSDKLSYQNIKDQLNLPDGDVASLLHSLSCAKYNILIKEPNTQTISQSDVFEFNLKFTDEMSMIKIPTPTFREEAIKDREGGRWFVIDAAIMRIMKSKKALPYQQLVKECVDQLYPGFQPDDASIKKRFEALIEREYLERDKDDRNLVKYLPP